MTEKEVKPSPEPTIVLRGHAGDVQCLAFCRSTRRLFSGDIDGVLRIWDPDLYKAVGEVTVHPAAGILSVCAAEDGNIFTQGREGIVSCWRLLPSGSLSTSPLLTLQTGCYNFCRCVVVPLGPEPDVCQPSSGETTEPGQDDTQNEQWRQGSNRTCSLTFCPTPFPLLEPTEAGKGSTSSSFTGGGQSALVAISGEDGNSLEIWDMRSGALACSFAVSPEAAPDPAKPARKSGMVMAVARVATAGAVVIGAGYEDGYVRLWDVRKPGSAPLAASRLHGETVTCLSFHPNGRRGASGAAESKVVLFELGASLGSIKPVAEQSTAAAGGEVGGRPGAADIAFRQDGRLLAVACWDGRVRLFDAKQGKPLASLKYHAKAASAVVFLGPEDGGIATAGRDGTVALWKVFPASGGGAQPQA